MEVHARQVIYTKAKVGFQSQHSLSFPARNPMAVRIYSNKPHIVFEPKERAGQMHSILQNAVNHFSMLVKVDRPQSCLTPTLVNCVNQHSGELVYSWLLLIECM